MSLCGATSVRFERLPDGRLLVGAPSRLVEATVVSPWSSATWRETVVAQFAFGVGLPSWYVARALDRAEIQAAQGSPA